jgi:hypothetical protein
MKHIAFAELKKLFGLCPTVTPQATARNGNLLTLLQGQIFWIAPHEPDQSYLH